MKMHEHDQELIMALAEGTLEAAAAEAATAEIAVCPDCSADLELQRLAISALDELPQAYLSATESSRLHSNLKRELKLEDPAPARASRSFAWGRWAPIAGVAAVFIFLAAIVPGMLGGGDDDAADMEFAATATTAAPQVRESDTPAAEDSMEDTIDDGTLDLGADGAGDAAEMAPTETTEAMAAAETTAAPETTAAADATTTTSGPSGIELLTYLGPVDELNRAELLTELESNLVLYTETTADLKATGPPFDQCLDAHTSPDIAPQLGIPVDSDPIVLGVVTDDTGEEFALVAYVPDAFDEAVFATVSITFCEVVELLP